MKKLRIMLVASEAVPFAKTGGLADVAGALPKALKELGHDVRIVMPRYGSINPHQYNLKSLPRPLGVPMGILGEQWCAVLEGKLPNSHVPIYFLEHILHYGRQALYNDANGVGFLDNDNRFIFLSRASLQLCKMLHFAPDIVHANDWHTSVVPLLLNTLYRYDPNFQHTASILTVHNMQYQGLFYKGAMDVLGIDWKHFNMHELEWHDHVNFLKGGICHATLWNTVSQGYAEEIQTSQYGYGLEGVARHHASTLRGIINGIDYTTWNPETDKHITAHYSETHLSGKHTCKRTLQRIFGLPERDNVPVFGIISRLVDQKGIDVLAESMTGIMSYDIQFVMLGTGESWAHDYFSHCTTVWPEKFGCYIGYDEALAHQIEAGCDFYVMPSRFEPCGLNQLYSLRYGTLPIIRSTGGLKDTVENFHEKRGTGTGFCFDDLNAHALYNTIGWAVYTWYNNPTAYKTMQKNAMKKRFTWEDSARKYLEMYDEAIVLKRTELHAP
jgi:starch synthase